MNRYLLKNLTGLLGAWRRQTKNNHEKPRGLLRVRRFHEQLMPVRRRISDRGLEIAYVWPRKENFANMLWKKYNKARNQGFEENLNLKKNLKKFF